MKLKKAGDMKVEEDNIAPEVSILYLLQLLYSRSNRNSWYFPHWYLKNAI